MGGENSKFSTSNATDGPVYYRIEVDQQLLQQNVNEVKVSAAYAKVVKGSIDYKNSKTYSWETVVPGY